MMHLVAVALGGALGALARYWVSGVLNNADYRLPLGTLTVNVLGSFLMGVCFVLILERARLSPELRPLLMVGFLGAFTTFSTFSLETVAMIGEGHVMSALIYISLSVLLCIAALGAGLWLTRLF
ncbi:fluoride efflux transporter CrcB [Marinobacterium sediminicola]|uniref:Fluoride-specific ion channel FluC n=1 Tax=Marinobacterium sediminicola TaxID=518898 RepID=A0ABY1S2I9_9GAMM|nr:fluoride efflux transporter CrcB [Marinobacterium sediminicola]ULG70714.1 fluoride efflux transporter CrcB [Marinobacterium sediminicola]SMR77301.1 camphor resistance protein CrcB [Marinobacterium sediminicola]